MILLMVAGVLAVGRAIFWLVRGSCVPPRRAERIGALVSFAAALLGSLALIFAPVYTSEETELISPGNFTTRHVFQQTLLDANGPPVLIFLFLIAAIAGLPLVFSVSRWRPLLEAGAATLLAAVVIVAGLSVGFFYLPSAAAMLVAAWVARPTAGVIPARSPNTSD